MLLLLLWLAVTLFFLIHTRCITTRACRSPCTVSSSSAILKVEGCCCTLPELLLLPQDLLPAGELVCLLRRGWGVVCTQQPAQQQSRNEFCSCPAAYRSH
jgi:hypothetical protein